MVEYIRPKEVQTRRLLVITAVVMVACVTLGLAGCGGSPSSPSAQPQLIEGTISRNAGGGNIVNFTATREGTLCTAPGSLDTHLCYAAWRSSYSSRASIGV